MTERLFIYGSLQPGGPNEHVLASVEGDWEPAVIKGKLIDAGWGASLGYPGLVLDDDGADVRGYVLSSAQLQSEWGRLDRLEGEEYERVIGSVTLASGEKVQAQVYVLRR